MDLKNKALVDCIGSFRMTPEENALYTKRAKEFGISKSQYFADIIRKAHENEDDDTHQILEEMSAESKLKEDSKVLSKIGVNDFLTFINNENKKKFQNNLKKVKQDHDNNLKTMGLHYQNDLKKAKQDFENRFEALKEKFQNDLKTSTRNQIDDIYSKNIVTPASKELIEVFDLIVKHYIGKGRIKYSYELLQFFLEHQDFWDKLPNIDKELLKKAKSKDFVPPTKK